MLLFLTPTRKQQPNKRHQVRATQQQRTQAPLHAHLSGILADCPPPAVHPVGIQYTSICQRVPEQNELSVGQLWVTSPMDKGRNLLPSDRYSRFVSHKWVESPASQKRPESPEITARQPELASYSSCILEEAPSAQFRS